MAQINLILGLGNPGEQFKNTRHNIGRATAIEFQKKYGLPEFKTEKKYLGDISNGKIGQGKTLVLLPNTFMNKSGQSAALIVKYLKIKTKNVLVIQDDADLPLGKAKLSFGRNSAGHKGVESLMRALKSKDFWRFRLGIGGKRNIPAEKLVLRKFIPEEEKTVKKIIKKTLVALEKTIKEGPEKARNEYNQ